MATLPGLLAGVDLHDVDEKIKASPRFTKKENAKNLFYTSHKKTKKETPNSDNPLVEASQKLQQEHDALLAKIKSGNISQEDIIKTTQDLAQRQQIFIEKFRENLETILQKSENPGEDVEESVNEEVKRYANEITENLRRSIEKYAYKQEKLPSLLSGVDLTVIDKSVRAEIKSIDEKLKQNEKKLALQKETKPYDGIETSEDGVITIKEELQAQEKELQIQKVKLQSKLFFIVNDVPNPANELVRIANGFQREYDRLLVGIRNGTLRGHEVAKIEQLLKQQQHDFIQLFRDYLETLPDTTKPDTTKEALITSYKKEITAAKQAASTNIENEAMKRLGVDSLEIHQLDENKDKDLIEEIKRVKAEIAKTVTPYDKQLAELNDPKLKAANAQTAIDASVNKLKKSIEEQTINLAIIAANPAQLSFTAKFKDKSDNRPRLNSEYFNEHSATELLKEAANRAQENSDSKKVIIKFKDLDAKQYHFTLNLSREAELVITKEEQGNGYVTYNFSLRGPNGEPRQFYTDANYLNGLLATIDYMAADSVTLNLTVIQSKFRDAVVKRWINAGRSFYDIIYPGVEPGAAAIIARITEKDPTLFYRDLNAYLHMSDEDKNGLDVFTQQQQNPNFKAIPASDPKMEKYYNIQEALLNGASPNELNKLKDTLKGLSEANYSFIKGHVLHYFDYHGQLEKNRSKKVVKVVEEKPAELITMKHDAYKQRDFLSLKKLRSQDLSSDHTFFISDKYSLKTRCDIFESLHVWHQRNIINAIEPGKNGENRLLLKELISRFKKTDEQKFLAKQKLGDDTAPTFSLDEETKDPVTFLLDKSIAELEGTITNLKSQMAVNESSEADLTRAKERLAQLESRLAQLKSTKQNLGISEAGVVTETAETGQEFYIRKILENKGLSDLAKANVLSMFIIPNNGEKVADVNAYIAGQLLQTAVEHEDADKRNAQIITNIHPTFRPQLLQALNKPIPLPDSEDKAPMQQAAETDKVEHKKRQTIGTTPPKQNSDNSAEKLFPMIYAVITNTHDPLILQQLGENIRTDILQTVIAEEDHNTANVKRMREILKGVIIYEKSTPNNNKPKPTNESENKQYKVFSSVAEFLTIPADSDKLATLYSALTEENRKNYIGIANTSQLVACASKMTEAEAKLLLPQLGADLEAQKQIFDALKPEIQAKVFSTLAPEIQNKAINSDKLDKLATLNAMSKKTDEEKNQLAKVFNEEIPSRLEKANLLAQLDKSTVEAVLKAENKDKTGGEDKKVIDQKQYDVLGKMLLSAGKQAKLAELHAIRNFTSDEVKSVLPKPKAAEPGTPDPSQIAAAAAGTPAK